MSMKLREFRVREVIQSSVSQFRDGTLQIDVHGLSSALREADERLDSVEAAVVAPGDSARILCVKDVVEPRVKLHGDIPAQGTVNVLRDCAVVTCGPIVGFQEGIIDASGPGSRYSAWTTSHLIVLQLQVKDGLTAHQHEEVVRQSGLRAAESLARLTINDPADTEHVMEWVTSGVDPSLPKIAYVYMLLSQGLLHDTYVMGQNVQQMTPRVVDPRLVFETRIVSGNCVSACDKNTTWHHQNNPVIQRLLEGHGTQWNFIGVVVTGEPTRLGLKESSARTTIELVQHLQADGAVISKEGFGNPDADLMMLIRGLERSGIRTVAITDEYAGPDGASQSLADTTPEADAIVSTGNANERIVLPPVERTVGPLPDVARLAGGYPHSVRDDGGMEVELQALVGATNQLGCGFVTCREI